RARSFPLFSIRTRHLMPRAREHLPPPTTSWYSVPRGRKPANSSYRPLHSFDSRFQLQYHGRLRDYALPPKTMIVSCTGTTEVLTMRRLGVLVTFVVLM